MNGDLEKLVDELESFDSSIRHLPIAEQQRLRKNRRDSMDKKANQAKKIAMIGFHDPGCRVVRVYVVQQYRLRKFSCHHINNDTFPLSYVAG